MKCATLTLLALAVACNARPGAVDAPVTPAVATTTVEPAPPIEPPHESAPRAASHATCNTSSDCAAGERCCLAIGTGKPGPPETMTSVDVACVDTAQCWMERCDTAASCPRGLECSGSEFIGVPAVCVSPIVAVACGNGLRCARGAGACEWRAQAGQCAHPARSGPDSFIVSCTTPADCAGGQHCCVGSSHLLACEATCHPSVEQTLCAKDVDCPPSAPHCVPAAPPLPSWLRACAT